MKAKLVRLGKNIKKWFNEEMKLYFSLSHWIVYGIAFSILIVTVLSPNLSSEVIKEGYSDAGLTILIAISAIVIPIVDLIKGGKALKLRKKLANIIVEIILVAILFWGLNISIALDITFLEVFFAATSYLTFILIIAEVIKIYNDEKLFA